MLSAVLEHNTTETNSPLERRKQKLDTKSVEHKRNEPTVASLSRTMTSHSDAMEEFLALSPDLDTDLNIKKTTTTHRPINGYKPREPSKRVEWDGESRQRGKGKGKGRRSLEPREQRKVPGRDSTLKLMTPTVSTRSLNQRGRLQSIGCDPSVEALRCVQTTPEEHPREWRIIGLNGVNMMVNDSHQLPTTVDTQWTDTVRDMMISLIRESGLTPHSPRTVFDDHVDMVRGILNECARARSSDVKIRDTRYGDQDVHATPVLPMNLVFEHSFPTVNTPVKMLLASKYSSTPEIADYQKWIESHVWYSPLRLPYVPEFVPFEDGANDSTQKRTIVMRAISGASEDLIINLDEHGCIENPETHIKLVKMAKIIESIKMEAVMLAVMNSMNSESSRIG